MHVLHFSWCWCCTLLRTAALLSKKALMRPIGSHNDNERAAKMERLLEDGINSIGLGPQGMGGKYSVMVLILKIQPATHQQ